MPPIQYRDTAVVDEPWDASAELAKIPNDASASTLAAEHAWVSESGSTKKGDYKLPHHKVVNGSPAAANLKGVRNALSRLPQTTGVPSTDFNAIRSHLNKHLSKGGGPRSEDIAVDMALVVEAEGHVWAVRPEVLTVLSDLHGRVASDVLLEEIRAAQGAMSARVPKVQGNGVAVIPLKGMLMPQASLISLLFGGGGSGLLGFRSQLKAAAADPEVKSIVMDVDSPGGYVDLIPEIAADIRAAGEEKPIVAVANTMAASAAYWLAAQAHEVIASPSAEVGSIGVYQLHLDQSDAMAQKGIKPTLIKAGKFKIEANPYESLSTDGQNQMQEQVDDYYDMFTADVAAGRGIAQEDVQSGYGEGRTLTAARAKRAGLVDRVATLDQTVARLTSGRARVKRASDAREFEIVASEPVGPDPVESGGGTPVLSEEERGRLLDVVAGLAGND